MNDSNQKTNFQIVIPMSGFGERFRRAGYKLPKPLINIDGKPMVAHVIELFPGETDFIFVCNQSHLDNPEYKMAETLTEFCPTGKIVGIPAHKLGPVHAVMQVAHLLDPKRPIVVNYCDFSCYWSWPNFVDFVKRLDCDGAIPAYRGFHPHTLGTTNYAYIREAGGWVLDIQEKKPYTNNRMEEYASSGTYYFKSAALMLKAFKNIVADDLSLSGEFYVSLAYKPLLERGHTIAVYELQHFMQWGTPEDLEEYRSWAGAFQAMVARKSPVAQQRGAMIVPMAGIGERFSRAGYAEVKPMIEVSGQPMVIQAALDLPPTTSRCFVIREDMIGQKKITMMLRELFPNALTSSVAKVTQGQACTANIGLNALAERQMLDERAPVTFGVCDSGTLFDGARLDSMIDEGADLIVWTRRGHPHAARNPGMYGWIAESEGHVKSVSVKQPLSDPSSDPIVIGIFTFRTADVFRMCFERMLGRNAKVNGEFYLDTCINDALALGYDCRTFEVDAYFSWGTPNDLRTFEYWQSCFSKLPNHPYSLHLDTRIPQGNVSKLEVKYRAIHPNIDLQGDR